MVKRRKTFHRLTRFRNILSLVIPPTWLLLETALPVLLPSLLFDISQLLLLNTLAVARLEQKTSSLQLLFPFTALAAPAFACHIVMGVAIATGAIMIFRLPLTTRQSSPPARGGGIRARGGADGVTALASPEVNFGRVLDAR